MTINIDSRDYNHLIQLMDEHEKYQTVYYGKNKDGEGCNLSICQDHIVVTTYQTNGWVRINTYWRDGTREETFDGRWR